ncbi:hypothetical protein [Brevibacillus laterosporus]|uniref:hypothetical protein n=1 Tax=Brevibacillus laterosporus TaxID=1465 RepID=UPI000E6CF957|nr:hypothetical protein [Brevibacillus laterosporus]AYB37668.1 hypothetical protein D5F52_04865 [Brevibacillus laterosporus]MBM7111572.1 hypothetical protein [Brevibacillus laterosporus]
MVFLVLLFFTLNLISLFKGSLFYKSNYKAYEFTVRQYEGSLTEEETKDYGIRIFISFILSIAWVTTQIIFYLNALFIDQLKFYTTIMIAVMITNILVNVIKNKKSKVENDQDLEELKKQMYSLKKHTFKQKFHALLCICYFACAFYVLVL